MFLLQAVPSAEAASWGDRALREGGLAAVCIILLVILYILLKLYLKERKDKDAAVNKFIDDTAASERNNKADLDAKLKDQSNRYQAVIANKDKIIEKLETKNDQLEKQFRADLTKFLQESIEARHEITNSMEKLGRDNKDNVNEIIRALNNNS
jgi:hypothetical protein